MAVIYVPIGICPGCESDVLNDDQGRTVDPEGQVWHAECRKAERRKQQAPRRGRPPKTESAPDEVSA